MTIVFSLAKLFVMTNLTACSSPASATCTAPITCKVAVGLAVGGAVASKLGVMGWVGNGVAGMVATATGVCVAVGLVGLLARNCVVAAGVSVAG